MADKVATLHIPGQEPIELPILSGTEGPEVIDVRALGAHGYFTYDPGFLSTASCTSKLTYIDGDAGILLYRGYPIAELAKDSNYLEVCYLLLNGELPTKSSMTNSAIPSLAIPWCMNRSRHCLKHSVVTLIRWR